MSHPRLKRVRLGSVRALTNWLGKAGAGPTRVMLVSTLAEAKALGPAEIAAALAPHGWTAGRRYTMNGGLLGQVIERGADGRPNRPLV